MSVKKNQAIAESQLMAARKGAAKRHNYSRPGGLFLPGAAFWYGLIVAVACLALAEPRESSGSGQVLSYENLASALPETEEADAYQVTMSPLWRFDGKSFRSIEMYVENVPENSDKVYFELSLSEAPERILYLSPVLAPGDILTEIKLAQPILPGEYDALVTYYVSGEASASAEIPMSIRIQVL